MIGTGRSTRVLMACTGLGRMHRGYESFTNECFAAIGSDAALDVTLFGSGATAGGRRVPSLRRDARVARLLGKLCGRPGYSWEQATFALGLLPHLLTQRPNVVFVSDISLGRLLAHLRPLVRLRYRLLLSNGGLDAPPYRGYDHVQQLAPAHLELALAAGVDPHRQTLLPYGITADPWAGPLSDIHRSALRDRLGLPTDQPILLSVAAIDRRQKRLDHLISEVAQLGEERPFLVLLGHREPDAPAILRLASASLGSRFVLRSVPRERVDDYYRAADGFVLSSLIEGLPRALMEAAARGLPCLVYDTPVTRFVLASHGHYAEPGRPGALAGALPGVLEAARDERGRVRLSETILKRFSWPVLTPAYVDMLQRVATAPLIGL